MARLVNEPAAFADESAAGFARAFAPWVRPVPGGVVRHTAEPVGQVALVIGGGSGHYPAFAGLVGPGLAHGAAMGNIFASPSAQQVYSVARAANRGQGVLLSYGNYAGDVLNFDLAERRLRSEGIDCETVLVTDDVSSAPPAQRDLRRGVAGGLVVFKVAGAACAEGRSLAEVARLARRANDRTRTLGVAFGGCALPGADRPLFTVPPGRMALGMGIHGEPGIDETDVPTADGLAGLLVDRLLRELPDDVPTVAGRRAVVLLNGLGSVKYEELFVMYGSIAGRLDEAGVEVVEPEVGELVTSFDMAGVSLTLCWLDEELERLWCAPASTPALRKSTMVLPAAEVVPSTVSPTISTMDATVPATAAARFVGAALTAAARCVDEHVDELGRLDAVAGDGDHGIGMRRGVHAALAAAELAIAAGAGAGATLRRAADAWADRAGGTSGALWSVGLTAFAATIDAADPDNAPDAETADPVIAAGAEAATAAVIAAGIEAATAAVVDAGGAALGDRTMVDALVPFRDAFRTASPQGVRAALMAAVPVAEAAAVATADLVPRIGRARAHAAKRLGTPDPGAVSLALILRAVLNTPTVEETQ